MKLLYTLFYLFLCTFSISASADCRLEPNAKIVLLKLDDLVGDVNTKVGVSTRWQKVTDFLESNSINASFGLIGESLAGNNTAYYNWVKKRIELNSIEIWNHGFFNRFVKNKALGIFGEFNGTSSEGQRSSLINTQILGKEKLNITFKGFGPHDSAVDDSTYSQLDEIKEIKYVWFYMPTDMNPHNAFVFKRTVNLEYPIFRPNFEAFLQSYRNRPLSLGYLALQGHPNMWTKKDFNQFKLIVQFLRKQNSVFCKPSDVLDNTDSESSS